MNILVVGAGGREHALAWKLAGDGHRVVCAPGNPGMRKVAECCAVNVTDSAGIERLARERACELVVVGPEAPLVDGLGDRLRAAGFAVFGPGTVGARLEGSKAFCKQLLAAANVRTAPFRVVSSPEQIAVAVAEIAALGTGLVVKADGLAGGKGVTVCTDAEQARRCASEFLSGQRFGDAGRTVVVEQRLFGRELSVTALVDGTSYRILAQAEDHKALGDGDTGPNTGGMGAVSPCSWVETSLTERISSEVFAPTLAELLARGIDYRGALYAGLMIDESGAPWVLEYNCRFGDPETQVLMVRLRADLGAWLAAAAHGHLPAEELAWDPRAAVCVVLASAGYPGPVSVGRPIHGAQHTRDDAVIFTAGVARERADESLVSAGGRVLGITALGTDVAGARERVYSIVSTIKFDGMHYRTDIGARSTGLRPEKEKK